ncbi:MAG: polynucleotide adenylyltransferase/metal dependent phosphohydrolase [Thermoleophilia bacterium]|nr:polynucleotide adenylyltransferase/metal dependent phosphohydrolase [Thermoleophilia bacterium]
MSEQPHIATLEALRATLVDLLGPELALDTWLVGGVVRDALLERALPDIDIVTAHDPEQVARRLRAAVGGAAFPLGDDHGCWRVTVAEEQPGSRFAGVLQFDVCSLRGERLDDDLAARDFTANALAVALVGELQVIDRAGGVDDLRAAVLRMVGPDAFSDDPLRMLRAARLAHTLGWEIEPDTVAAIRACADRAGEPAGERTFAELQLLLLHPEARRGWQRLGDLDLDRVLLPELDACRGMAQSRFHHLDVHDHTLAVLDNCEDLLEATDFWLPLPSALDPAVQPWSDQQRLTVLLAALCHDLGKPPTRVLRDDGRVSFVGHDDAGLPIVDAIAERWRWSARLRDDVRRLVSTHLALGFLLHSDRGPRQRWRFLRAVEPVAAEAIVLSVGDRLATAGPYDRRRWVRAHLDLARAVWADHWREARDGRPVPLLDGTAIAAAVGISPGPKLGPLVRGLAEAQAVGAVTTVEQAEALVRSLSEPTAPMPSPRT